MVLEFAIETRDSSREQDLRRRNRCYTIATAVELLHKGMWDEVTPGLLGYIWGGAERQAVAGF